MLRDIVAFEWRMHTRQAAFFAAAAIFFGFGAVFAATGFGPGNVNINSPYSIAQSLALLTIFSVFVSAMFCANAIVRDREHRMEEIVFTTAMGKFEFLFGRFIGSFGAAVTVLAFAVPGLVAGALIRGNADGRLGPFGISEYLWPFAIIVVPSMLFAATLVFAVATTTRSVLASHVAAVFIYVLYFVASSLTNSPLMAGSTAAGSASGSIGALLDPFGLSAFFEQTRYWPPAVRNTRLIALSGSLLVNRIFGVGLAALLWAIVYRSFAFRVLSRGKAGAVETVPESTAVAAYVPAATTPRRWPAFYSLARIELRSLVRNVPFILVLLMWMLLGATEVVSSLSGEHGSSLLPVTSIVLEALAQPLKLLALITLVYFGMEIVWRDRSSRMADIVDATPASSGSFVLAKWLALSAAVALLIVAGLAVAIVAQLVGGGTPELKLYLWFAWVNGLPLVLFAGLTVFIHTLSRQKYAGMLVVIMAAVLLAVGGTLPIPHNLLRFGSAPPVAWSDMNGFAPHVLSFHTYMLHWSVLAALFLVIAAARWRRSPVPRPTVGTLAVAATLTAAFIIYNTTILNAHVTSDALNEWKADYERQYKRYASLSQPVVDRIEGSVDFFPEERRARVQGRYRLVNPSAQPISRVLVAVHREASSSTVALAGARLASHDRHFGHYWFDLEKPLGPGAAAILRFDLTFASRGFEDGRTDYSVAANGSYLTNLRALPTIGYRATYELSDAAARKKYGLGARTGLEPVHGEARPDGWVTFDLTLSTNADQTAITSGQLVRSWTDHGRRFFRYQSETPVPDSIAFVSGRYSMARTTWRSLAVELHYDSRHGTNAELMLRAATESLAIFEKSFGPYRYRQLRLVEVPSYWQFGGFASPGMVVFPENRIFLTAPAPPGRIDLVYRRTAHEVAHQWWGHSVSAANVPGGATIVETLTKYSEMLALDVAYGSDVVRQNIEFELDRYLRGRADQRGAEPPLARVHGEAHLYYGKGTVVMSGLRDLLGEARLNGALASFASSQSGPGKRPTTRELIAALNAVASSAERELIASWLEDVVIYDIDVTSAASRKLDDGRYEVTLNVKAGRVRIGADGKETPLSLRETIAFALRNAEGRIVHMSRHQLNDGANAITMLVSEDSATVEADPDFTRVDANRGNNVRIQTPAV
jgi:ABC-type transport system involved in multi-copper enzyme maturation permease subunit